MSFLFLLFVSRIRKNRTEKRSHSGFYYPVCQPFCRTFSVFQPFSRFLDFLHRALASWGVLTSGLPRNTTVLFVPFQLGQHTHPLATALQVLRSRGLHRAFITEFWYGLFLQATARMTPSCRRSCVIHHPHLLGARPPPQCPRLLPAANACICAINLLRTR